MIQLVESASASERVDAARVFIEGHPPDAEIIIIGASRGAADDLARLITVRRGAAFGLHCYGLVQLAARLALTTMVRQGLAPAPTLGSQPIAARVRFQMLERRAQVLQRVARFSDRLFVAWHRQVADRCDLPAGLRGRAGRGHLHNGSL